MRLLLDTHALLWWFTDDSRLSTNARNAVMDEANAILVSAASAWEIATKQRIGKLGLPEAVSRFDELVTDNGFEHLPVIYRHSLLAGDYDVPHRDPFDRMLAAQAELESARLVTRDPAFEQFGSDRLW